MEYNTNMKHNTSMEYNTKDKGATSREEARNGKRYGAQTNSANGLKGSYNQESRFRETDENDKDYEGRKPYKRELTRYEKMSKLYELRYQIPQLERESRAKSMGTGYVMDWPDYSTLTEMKAKFRELTSDLKLNQTER